MNNYIQSNYLKSRGKAEHDDWPISKILESIIEDLNTLENEKSRTREELPVGLIIRDLKFLHDKQKSLKDTLDTISSEIDTLKSTQADPSVDLGEIIKKLDAFAKQ